MNPRKNSITTTIYFSTIFSTFTLIPTRADLTSWKKSLCLQETEGTTENHNWSRCWDTNPNWYTYNSALHLRLRKNYGICHRKTCGGQKMRNSIFSTRPEAAPIQFQQHGLLSKIYKMITSVYLQTWVGKPHSFQPLDEELQIFNVYWDMENQSSSGMSSMLSYLIPEVSHKVIFVSSTESIYYYKKKVINLRWNGDGVEKSKRV